jgi:DNA-binding SARP family transcriptional activator
MGFRFTLLGPLTVRRGAEPLPLGPAKRRAMLATLVLAANDPVSIDRLTDTVWDNPPTSAVANLRTHAAALRQLLFDDDGTNRLRSLRRAYRLVVGDGELDLAEFDDLAGQGRDARAEGDLTTAVRHFGAALALWHGEPAQNVPTSGAMEAMLAPLKEHWLLVFEDYADTQLALAEHNAILGELQQQAVLHPHRERIWEQLALARYRSGNVVGALNTVSEAFSRLREDLGIEPGEPMRRLHQAILQRDPALTWTPAVASRPIGRTLQRPRQLPPDPRVLTGRESEAQQLLKLLTPEPRTTPVVVVSGPPGAGSSALALHAAHRVADHFPGGELYADLRGAEPPIVLDRFLRALGVDAAGPATVEERAAAFRSSTHTGVLVVLDHAADAAHVRPLLPGEGSAVLATSRRRLMTLDGAALLEVGALSVEAGTAALAAMLGDDRVAAEPTAAAHLVQLCDGLPLALRIAAARLASRPTWPVSVLADRLADPRCRLDVLTFEDLSVRDALAATYDALAADDPAAARVLRRLGTLPAGTVDAAVVAGQLAAPRRVVADALERLVDVRLLESTALDRYRITGLIHLYAAELATGHCAHAATDPRDRQTA